MSGSPWSHVDPAPKPVHHFVVPRDAIEGESVRFSPAQQRQMARVLRLRDGDEVVALDGQGAQYRARLTLAGKTVIGCIVGPATRCQEPAGRVTLMVAPPRGERWEWVLQKGTEIGVARFRPIITRYSQPGSATVKDRHRDIVREATEQCRRLMVPGIDEPRPFEQAVTALAHQEDTVSVLLWEGVRTHGLGDVLRPLRPHDPVCLIVGPEGGFHPEEVALARDRGVAIAGLGPLVLRTETAAVAAAALVLLGQAAPA